MIVNRNVLIGEDYYAKGQEIKKNDKNLKELNDSGFVDGVEEAIIKEAKAETK